MKELLTTILCMVVLSASAQYNENDNFKHAFKQQMQTPTDYQKVKLNLEQRDIVHHHIAGSILLAFAAPIVTSSIITFAKQGENTNMAATGLAFGGMAFGGSITLHAIGFKKLHKYRKTNKKPQ